MTFDDELNFEKEVINELKRNGWKDGVISNPTEQDLIKNWANIIYNNNRSIDRLGDYPLTDGEMGQILSKVNMARTPININKFINGKTVMIIRDNPNDKLHFGQTVSLKIFDRDEIASGKSVYQIVEQPHFTKKSFVGYNRRGDLMLLINGMPLFHIELKKSGIPIEQATTQIEKYAYEGMFSGIYQLIQIFVAMTPNESKYYANPGPDGKFNPLFYFHWENFNNELVLNWSDFTSKLLSIPMAHQLIGFFTVADDGDGTLKVMRSYQYNAVNKIHDVVATTDWNVVNLRGGYVWHTTGSGKTMTSFKSAALLADTNLADKVVFLVDRIELDVQSLDSYRGFIDEDKASTLTGTASTDDLIATLKDKNTKLIVTSIQKASLIKESAYQNEIDMLNQKRIVFIVDECHRDTFGEMMAAIKDTFKKSIYFGFTGTPIITGNEKNESVTADVFGNELCRYTIADGIRDKNVLGFDLYGVQTYSDNDLRTAVGLHESKSNNLNEVYGDPQKEKIFNKFRYMDMCSTKSDDGVVKNGIEDYIPSSQYNCDVHRRAVVENIVMNWKLLSSNNEFSAIFATNSIPEAISYYRVFKEYNEKYNLKVCVLVDPNIDNKEGFKFKLDGLKEIYEDYNEMYNTAFSLSESAKYKDDIRKRLAHKTPYKYINEEDKLNLLIVVDQMLTGFDSKWINTLYLDKVIKNELIIQAFSRTNRIYNELKKPFGTIKYYRKVHTMKRNIEKAIKDFSGENEFEVYVSKLEENTKEMKERFEEIKDLFESEGIANFSKLPEDKETIKKFVKLFNQFYKTYKKAIIQGYSPSNDIEENSLINGDYLEIKEKKEKYGNREETITLCRPIMPIDVEVIKKRYDEASNGHENKDDDLPYEIDSTIIEIDDGKIDYEYMNLKFNKYLRDLEQKKCTPEELKKALDDLHKSFANLSQDFQKNAILFLNDIERGEIQVESDKSFFDYILEYKSKTESDIIKKMSNWFGYNELMLRALKSASLNENNLDAYGRYTDLVNTRDINRCKEVLEKKYNKKFELFEVVLKSDQILKDFLLKNEFINME